MAVPGLAYGPARDHHSLCVAEQLAASVAQFGAGTRPDNLCLPDSRCDRCCGNNMAHNGGGLVSDRCHEIRHRTTKPDPLRGDAADGCWDNTAVFRTTLRPGCMPDAYPLGVADGICDDFAGRGSLQRRMVCGTRDGSAVQPGRAADAAD